jgi:hypothetical protein
MKQIIIFLSILFTVQIGTAQEIWNACNSTVTVIPAPSYDSTFVLEAPSRAALQKGMANWVPASSGGAASYLVYTALLTQSGTDAPVATVLENTLGGTVVWAYEDVGSYSGSISGGFDAEKTGIIMAVSVGFEGKNVTGGDIYIYTYDETYTGSDDYLDHTFIEIRVYP